MAQNPGILEIRIKGLNGEAKDWQVPSDVSFRMVLVSKCWLVTF